MLNHENGHTRPTYLAIIQNNILWFIPLSTRIDKYKKIIEKKKAKYGFCNTILIRKIGNKEVAILFQNAFPTLEKYVSHIHTIDGIDIKLIGSLESEILKQFNDLLKLKQKGINLFLTDVNKIEEILLKELVIMV